MNESHDEYVAVPLRQHPKTTAELPAQIRLERAGFRAILFLGRHGQRVIQIDQLHTVAPSSVGRAPSSIPFGLQFGRAGFRRPARLLRAPHRPWQRIAPPQSVQHRSADAVRRIRGERDTAVWIILSPGLEEAEDPVVHQLAQLDDVWQAAAQCPGDRRDQR